MATSTFFSSAADAATTRHLEYAERLDAIVLTAKRRGAPHVDVFSDGALFARIALPLLTMAATAGPPTASAPTDVRVGDAAHTGEAAAPSNQAQQKGRTTKQQSHSNARARAWQARAQDTRVPPPGLERGHVDGQVSRAAATSDSSSTLAATADGVPIAHMEGEDISFEERRWQAMQPAADGEDASGGDDVQLNITALDAAHDAETCRAAALLRLQAFARRKLFRVSVTRLKRARDEGSAGAAAKRGTVAAVFEQCGLPADAPSAKDSAAAAPAPSKAAPTTRAAPSAAPPSTSAPGNTRQRSLRFNTPPPSPKRTPTSTPTKAAAPDSPPSVWGGGRARGGHLAHMAHLHTSVICILGLCVPVSSAPFVPATGALAPATNLVNDFGCATSNFTGLPCALALSATTLGLAPAPLSLGRATHIASAPPSWMCDLTLNEPTTWDWSLGPQGPPETELRSWITMGRSITERGGSAGLQPGATVSSSDAALGGQAAAVGAQSWQWWQWDPGAVLMATLTVLLGVVACDCSRTVGAWGAHCRRHEREAWRRGVLGAVLTIQAAARGRRARVLAGRRRSRAKTKRQARKRGGRQKTRAPVPIALEQPTPEPATPQRRRGASLAALFDYADPDVGARLCYAGALQRLAASGFLTSAHFKAAVRVQAAVRGWLVRGMWMRGLGEFNPSPETEGDVDDHSDIVYGDVDDHADVDHFYYTAFKNNAHAHARAVGGAESRCRS